MSRIRLFVTLLLMLHVGLLLWVAATLPIGPHEAKIFFTQHTPVARLMQLGYDLFPQASFLNIRAPFLVLHLVNLFLFYRLSRLLLKDEVQIYTAFVTFLLLPGIVSSAVLATSTGMILALYQAFLILCLEKKRWAAYALLPLFLLIDKSCVIFYFALLTYALWGRHRRLLLFSATLFGVSLSLYGINMHGKPVNYFVDTVALYAAIFSPLLFLYFFYAMYRILLKGEKNIIWHVSFVVLLLSLVISLRQRIPIEDFAPYVIVAIPLMVRLFFRSYRVRLPRFRRRYFYAVVFVYTVLVLNTLLLFFHRPLFLVLQNPRHHFAASFYLPYWCAEALRGEGIRKIRIDNAKRAYQFRFYGIEPTGDLRLTRRPSDDAKSVTIRYKGREIERCYVSKINN